MMDSPKVSSAAERQVTEGKEGTNRQANKNEKSTAQKQKPSCACSPYACIGWGCLFCLIYCVLVAVATHVHWPESSLCAFPPWQDANVTDPEQLPPDYPNPRCPDSSRFNNDTGAYWYYWRAKDYVWYSQLTAWVLYLGHQLSSWYIIFAAQMQYSSDKRDDGALLKEEKYSPVMRKWNWWAFGINFTFVVLHLLQTHFMGYDALAPSVHEMASQGSVIIMLVIVMMMETDRRGMWFGQPMSLFLEAIDVAKRYHGYIFSWAVIFTFWYHPMEGYLGHLFGIFHVLIIMVQGSLMFTDAHLNRYWRMILEAWVFLHAAVISTQTLATNSWTMFLFGFGAIFVISQLPGLPFMQRWHVAVRLIPCFLFAIIYVATFVMIEQWTSPAVVAFIPSAMYLGAIALNLIIMLCLVAGRACCESSCSREANVRPRSTKVGSIMFGFLFVIIMGITIGCSVLAENVLDRNGMGAAILVYGSMCVSVVFALVALQCALPRPTNEARRTGCVPCCCWKTKCCNEKKQAKAAAQAEIELSSKRRK